MTMRVKHKVGMQVGLDAAFNRKLFYHELEGVLQNQQIDTFQRAIGGNYSIAASSAQTLNPGDVTQIRGIYLEVGADCQVDVNGLGAIALVKSGTVAKLFLEATITSVEVTNPSVDTPLEVEYCMWGDPS